MTLRTDIKRLQEDLGDTPNCLVCGDRFTVIMKTYDIDGRLTRCDGEVCAACGSPGRHEITFQVVPAANV